MSLGQDGPHSSQVTLATVGLKSRPSFIPAGLILCTSPQPSSLSLVDKLYLHCIVFYPSSVALPGSGATGHKTTRNFMSHKMTQNNIQNKVHVAATTADAEYKFVWRGNRTKSLSDFVQL